MLQLEQGEGGITPQKVFKLPAREFSSDQQTPVLWQQHLYGVRQNDQQLVCMDLDGKEVWSSGQEKFGSGPYLIADGLIFVLDSEGTLTVAEATSAAYRRTARAKVIENGSDSWGPMALVAEAHPARPSAHGVRRRGGALIVERKLWMIAVYVGRRRDPDRGRDRCRPPRPQYPDDQADEAAALQGSRIDRSGQDRLP